MNSVSGFVLFNSWVLTQNRNCATQLTGSINGSPLADQTVTYADNSALVTKASGFADFFTPLYTATCQTITACTLKVSGCGSAYTTGNLIISSAGVITAKQNVDAGYADTVCVSCSNGHGSTVEHDNWTVTQSKNCGDTLSLGSVTDQAFTYDASLTTTSVYTSA